MKAFYFLTVILLAVALVGCGSSSGGGFGEKLASSGDTLKKASQNWHNAHALVKQGQEEIKAGKAQIENGKKMIQSGEAKIKKGQVTTKQIEAAFKAIAK